jgi:alpha-glucosidase
MAGVDAVWLSPIYRSPMKDFGYDVSDHCDVDPLFGSLADVDALIAAAHERGLEVWLDFVPNHTSDQHPWFQDAIGSREAPKRDWYMWRDPGPTVARPTTGPALRRGRAGLDLRRGHRPVLPPPVPARAAGPQLGEPELREAMLDVLRFWMARGVDGFRSDVIHMIGKSPRCATTRSSSPGTPVPGHHHEPDAAVPHLQAIRRCLDEHPGVTMVGEVNLPDARRSRPTSAPDRLHLAFQFGCCTPRGSSILAGHDPRVHASFEAAGSHRPGCSPTTTWSRVATRVRR